MIQRPSTSLTLSGLMAVLVLSSGCASQPSPRLRLPPVEIVSRAAWADREPIADRLVTHQPIRLTIHHAGVNDDGAAPGEKKMRGLLAFSLDQKPWGDVPYHFVIDRQGRIFAGRALEYAPDTNTGYDVRGHVGICVNGNLAVQPLEEAQYRSLVALSAHLASELSIPDSRIAGHMDFAPTDCPGVLEHFIRDGTLVADLRAYRDGRPFTFVAGRYDPARLRKTDPQTRPASHASP